MQIVVCVKLQQRKNMKTYEHEKKDKTPEEQLGLAKIQIMFEDSFGIFNAKSGYMTKYISKEKKIKQLNGFVLKIVNFSVTLQVQRKII